MNKLVHNLCSFDPSPRKDVIRFFVSYSLCMRFYGFELSSFICLYSIERGLRATPLYPIKC